MASRRIALVLALAATALGALTLSACGDDDESPAQDGANTTPAQGEQTSGGGEESTEAEDAPSGDDQAAEGDGGGEDSAGDEAETESGDSGSSAPAPGGATTEAINALALGASLDEVVDELGVRPILKKPGPGGTTCYRFRIRPREKSEKEPEPGTPINAELCFKNGKLAGTSLVTKTAPAK